MFRLFAIALLVAADLASLSAATLLTRDGQTVSGNLQQISETGVRLNGKAFAWDKIRKVHLAPVIGAKAQLQDVTAKIWRGSFSSFQEATARDPSSMDDVQRPYVTVRRLGNTPGAILFEGRLIIPREGKYQFRMATDDGARLQIGKMEVISTPAEFSYRRASGAVQLDAGDHPFRLEYLNLASYAILELEWSGPGLAWTALSVTKELPLPPALPAIPAAGALAWNGSYIAHPVESLTESRVQFVGDPAGIRLTTVNAAAIFFQPLSLPVADRIRSGKVGREGVLLVGGDFLEGEITSIKNNRITLQTLLFGAKQYQGGSQAAAVYLQKPTKPREQWVVQTRLGTEIHLRNLEWDEATLVADQTPFRKLRLKADEIHEIAFRSAPNILERAWANWGSLNEQQQRQITAGQGQFDSVFKARAEAKVYLAQLDEKHRRLEFEHTKLKQDVTRQMAGLQAIEANARKARTVAAQVQGDLTLQQRRRHVNVHLFNPQLRGARELAQRRLEEAKRILEAEQKALKDTAKVNAAHVDQYVKGRQRQLDQYEKHAADQKKKYDQARAQFHGAIKPVQIAAAVVGKRKAREYSENQLNQARNHLNQYLPQRDAARRQWDEAQRKVNAAKAQRDAQARLLEQAEAHEANVFNNQLKPVEKKLLQLRIDYAAKSAVYHKLIGVEPAMDQDRVDALSHLQAADQHVREWERQLRTAQGKLRQDEQNKNNASRDHARRRDLLEAARRELHGFVDEHEQPALRKVNQAQVRWEQLKQQVAAMPENESLVAQMKQAEDHFNKENAALKSVREKLNGVIGKYQSKLHDYNYHHETTGRTADEWVRTQGDIRLIELFLAAKKARQAELKQQIGELTRQQINRMNQIRMSKGEMDRALTAVNQALAEHGRLLGEYGKAVAKRFEAARNLEDREYVLSREQFGAIVAQAWAELREKEGRRREGIVKEMESVLVAADRALKSAEAAKRTLKQPLDGEQESLARLLGDWLQAQEQAAHYPKETGLEAGQITGALEADYLRWEPSIQARQKALNQIVATEKAALAAEANNLKEQAALDQEMKTVEADDKSQQAKQTAAIKSLAEASNQLRDARYRAGGKQREWLEAAFQHERYRVQKRAVLGFE